MFLSIVDKKKYFFLSDSLQQYNNFCINTFKVSKSQDTFTDKI